jgi:tetratricopeptide (TPR) repeat protein
MARSQAPLPEGIKLSISHGRYAEAADALRTLVRREPSVAVLVALADMNFQLGDLTEAKENALKAVTADPREHSARVLLARVRTALDERDAALADFRAALELARPRTPPAGGGPIALPAHQALHNLEQQSCARHAAAGACRLERRGSAASSTRCSMAPAARSPRFPWAANTVGCWPIRRS